MTPEEILKRYWGYDQFRPLQKEIIEASIAREDVLALMPTGGGKSICFQVPALCVEGVCIVVTPLIALMRDQVEQLKKRNIKAVAIHSGLSAREIDILLDNCAHDPMIKFLYLSPERLKSDLLLERIKKIKVSFLAIDEAHCISQWGYDFRPSYLELAEFRKKISSVSVIALTATATPDVKKDIIEKLSLRHEKVFVKSFSRANLSYSCFAESDKIRKMLEILANVPGPAIVYVRSRKNTTEIADFLKKQKISASAYHAGMTTAERNNIQDLWIHNQTRVMVATNAFGMGIDKPDVRVVIHLAPPDSLEAYYQEAGRAGRDEKKAYAVLLYTKQELEDLHLKIGQKYPSADLIRKTYQSLANYFKIAVGSSLLAAYDFNEEEFVKIYKLPKKETFHALRRLESEGFIQLTEGYHRPSRLHISVEHTYLYDYQLTHPEMDRFIKSILRCYGGELFETFLEISEQRIAAQAELNTAEVRKKIQYLQSIQLVQYEPAHTAPQIVFTTARYDAAKLPLNVREMELRKEKEIEKINYLAQYASQERRCRSLVLQEYFGERSDKKCGVCDICLKEKKQTISSASADTLRASILQTIRSGVNEIDVLANVQKNFSKEEILQTIREMTDEGILKIDKAGHIFISGK
ncbi:MAG TPA: ATP-dependent DNA helicase RecQ [Cytophagaceae bacterium]|nr:ATP-dependent DNA helicase RecQ [Cytophagaceae bacterium]